MRNHCHIRGSGAVDTRFTATPDVTGSKACSAEICSLPEKIHSEFSSVSLLNNVESVRNMKGKRLSVVKVRLSRKAI